MGSLGALPGVSCFAVGQLLSDLWFNIWSALKFTSWESGYPAVTVGTERILLGLGGAAVAAPGIALAGYGALRRHEPIVPGRRPLPVSLAGALTLLLLSFPAYLVLASARSLWRTRFLAGIGVAVTFTAVAGLAALPLRRRALQLAVTAVLAGVVGYFGCPRPSQRRASITQSGNVIELRWPRLSAWRRASSSTRWSL